MRRRTRAALAKAGRRLPPTERRAIEILEAKDDWSKADIRKAYKKLIKVLHPDMNGGDRSQEEQPAGGPLGLGPDQGQPQLQVNRGQISRRTGASGAALFSLRQRHRLRCAVFCRKFMIEILFL